MKDSPPNYQKETQATDDYKDIEFLQWLSFFLLIVLIPSTIWLWKKFHPKPTPKQFDCTCEGCEKKSNEKINIEKAEMKSTLNKVKLYSVVLLWLLFAGLMFIVVTSKHEVVEPYNPYKILNIEVGASESEIKTAYRQLSKIYHPDKNPDKEDLYMEVSKAYKTLTDIATREKWEKYGNPEGPQRMSVGIALPSWLINKNNSPVVLTAYLLLLVVALPTAVFYWNKSTTSKLLAPIEQQTLALYYHVIDAQTRLKAMIEILAASTEYKSALPDRKSDEENLKVLYQKIPNEYKVKTPRFGAAYIVKGTILLYAHITRINSKDMAPTLKEDLQHILKTYRHYLTGAFQITREKRQLAGLVEICRMSQCIMQSAWEDQSLKQLPHIDNVLLQSLKSSGYSEISKFKNIDKEKRKELLAKGSLNDRQIKDVENILEKIPCQVGVKYKISSDSPTLLASSVCILEIEFTDQIALKKQKQEDALAAASTKKPAAASIKGGARKRVVNKKQTGADKGDKAIEDKSDDEEEQQEESSPKEEKKPKKEKKQKEKKLDEDGNEIEDEENDDSDSDFDSEYSDSDDDDTWEATPKKSLINPAKELYHTPFTFDDKPVSFWVILGNRSKNELVALGKTESFAPGQTLKIPFLSSAEIGKCNYTLYVLCDGYIGCDIEQEISINLEKNPRPIIVQQPNLPPQQPPPAAKEQPTAQQKPKQQEQKPVAAVQQEQPPAVQPQPPANPLSPQPKPLTQKQINQQQKQMKKQMKAQASSSSSSPPEKEKAKIISEDSE
ncbi:hypothetical protein DICPUDRAFT_155106 [Dictyostelium purpureum]|uniref:J domain-containing protein n=1 Tax=Dictyostelium purpureum TaxID=5786 RepID=F0ZT33_DICPU|nr:uncharacterized protein DICPUDRAFT_155106 [Dictyostelium purpureum]EGC32897.1 hypothetical protein DICPUDRAFT_155106 [Dictyostelium purpureum]|eukprot:XP_003290582.1 hypothetical protein DICPUDRAFT_155106 [Dictyostelium purpureum]